MMVTIVEVNIYQVRDAAQSIVVPNRDGNLNHAVMFGQELIGVIVGQSKLSLLANPQIHHRDRFITPIHAGLVIFTYTGQVEKSADEFYMMPMV